MYRLHHRCPLVTLVLLVCLGAFSSTASAGDGSGAISLTIPPNVRGEAMGGLYISETRDYSTRWGNPAALAFINKPILGLMYSKLVPDLADDVFYFYGGWVVPTTSVGTVQLDLTYLSYGESEAIDSDNNSLGTFSSYEVSPAVGLGFKFLPHVGLGVAVKYVRVDLAPESVIPDPSGSGSGSGTSWAFDLGGLYSQNRLRIAAVVANLGPDIAFIDNEQSDPMPRTLRLGGMYDVFANEVGEVRFGVEWERSLVTFKTASLLHVGGEFVYAGAFAVRAGYVDDKDGDIRSATGGFGFQWNNAAFEYANVPQATDLNRVHRFALWYRY
ncbi:MAG: PorV/PorQ family protein [Candidatus Krumholzibacteriia bacterium]